MSTLICRAWSSCFFLHCFMALFCRTADAGGAPVLQAIECSTVGNYTPTGAYAANLNQLLSVLPNSTVSKSGGFFNGSVGQATDTVYGLALCAADFSRADCMDCLTAASNSAGGVVKRCPGSARVVAMFDQCLLRYADRSFFGTTETSIVYESDGEISATRAADSVQLKQALAYLSAQAASSPERFAASKTGPYALVQCTWDMPSDRCNGCLDILSANASNLFEVKTQGERKTYSCRVRYSNSSFMVVPFNLSGTTTTGTVAPAAHSTNNHGLALVGSIVGSIVFVVASLAVAWICVIRKWRQKPRGPYSYAELSTATNSFSEERKLGQGTFGIVYRGDLQGQRLSVAVKKMQNLSNNAKDEFMSEVNTMSRAKHRNLVSLLGWCDENGHLLLVYELMARSLDEHLWGPDATTLDWEKRYRIIIDIGSGLQYLHTGCENCVLHRDIKPSNVMLNESFNAKLCDFGLVREVSHDETSRRMTVIGSRSYLDPECIRTGIVSKASDVYSFGVVLLEVACGRQPTMLQHGDNLTNSLVEWVRELLYHGKPILGEADKRLKGTFNKEEMTRVMKVGVLCVLPEPDDRPSITLVMDYLKGNREVPAVQLPANPPRNSATEHHEPSSSLESTCTTDYPDCTTDPVTKEDTDTSRLLTKVPSPSC